MTKNQKHKNKYNHYPEAFRREAVRRADDPNTTAADVAKELGIHPNQIYNWRLHYKRLSEKKMDTTKPTEKSTDESEEIRKLKREIEELKEERDFLKKAAAYFSNQKR